MAITQQIPFVNMSLLRKCLISQITFTRNVGKCNYSWGDEGIQYYGFKYFPRSKDFKDPPYEPSKLFRVERTKSLKGLPYWEIKLLEQFQLAGKRNNCYNIVKNIPENNHRLWKIKHLVKIVPITFPDGFPKITDKTCLQENGELKIIKQLSNQEDKVKLIEDFRQDVKKLDGDTLRRHSRMKWLSGWEG